MLSTLLIRSNGNPIVFLLVGIAAGAFAFYQGFRLLQRRRIILDTPVSKVRSASLGMVELSGLAAGPYTISAPVTGRDCYCHRTLVWEYKQCGKNKQWVRIAAECMHVPFFLDDNTGKILVDPRGAELDLHCDFHQEFCDSFFSFKPDVPANVRLLLSRHGVNTTNKIKVEEFCIKPKNALFVLGTVAENPGIEVLPQPIHDEEHNTLTFGKSLWAGSYDGGELWQQPVNAMAAAAGELSVGQRLFGGVTAVASSDDTGTGDFHPDHFASVSSPEVIRLPGKASAAKALDGTQQERIAAAMLKAGLSNPSAWPPTETNLTAQGSGKSATDGYDIHPAVVMTRGRENKNFLISWRSQRAVAQSLGWKCTLMIWGGAALILLGLYGLIEFTHWK
jgi:hypothetical protein